jgi:hypothetical protein
MQKRRPDPVSALQLILSQISQISQISKPLQSEQPWRLKNESVSTDTALLWIVAHHIPSLYLDGVVLRYSLFSYRSIWGTFRDYTRRRPKIGL